MKDETESDAYAGRVVDEHGKSIAGTTVYALQLSQPDESSYISCGRRSISTITDEEGRFAFSKAAVSSPIRSKGRISFDWERALCVVLADTGERCGFGMLTPDADGVVPLQPPVSLRMRVIDRDGIPVAGVRVSLETLTVADRCCGIYGRGPERWQPVSDAEGYIEWSGLPGPCAIKVEVANGDWARVQAQGYVPDRATKNIPEIRALKGASASGRVLLPGGSPASNLVVGFRSQDGTHRTSDATTDADGRYQARYLVPGECYLDFLYDPGREQYRVSDRQITFTAHDGEETVLDDIHSVEPNIPHETAVEERSAASFDEIDVPTGTVIGSIVSRTGAPILEARVELHEWFFGPVVAVTETDANGGYRFDDIPMMGYHIAASADGYLTGYSLRVGILWPDKPLRIDVKLKPLDRPVSGLVLDRDGNPVFGADVSVAGFRAMTDADGRFAVTATGGRLEITVHGPARTFAEVKLPAGRKTITITLEEESESDESDRRE